MGTLIVEDNVWPSCFPDLNGQVYLRGHITLSPVPAVGGSFIGILPMDPFGNCSCTPEDKDIIATTTAIAYPRDDPDVADVCIVRLLVSKDVFADVNLDRMIDSIDVMLVEKSPYFNINPFGESKCPEQGCGRVDVNQDGKVDQLDSTSITQSAYLGTNVTCGGIYAMAFSCGSSRKAPLTPAIGISLDSVTYFSDDGLIVQGKLLLNADNPFRPTDPTQNILNPGDADPGLIDQILREFDTMHSEVNGLKDTVRSQAEELHETRGELHEAKKRLETRLERSETRLERSETRLERSENLHEESKMLHEESKMLHEESKKRDEVHDEKLSLFSKITRSDGHSVMTDVFVSIGVVFICGILVLVFQKSQRSAV